MDIDVFNIFRNFKKVFCEFDPLTKKMIVKQGSEFHKSPENISDKNISECAEFLTTNDEKLTKLIAIKLGIRDLIIDVEDKKQDGIGKKSFEKLKKDFNLPNSLAMSSKSGGIHVHYRLRNDEIYKNIKLKHKNYPDIEFLKNKRLTFVSDNLNKMKIIQDYPIIELDNDSLFLKTISSQEIEKKNISIKEDKIKYRNNTSNFPIIDFQNHIEFLLNPYDSNDEYNDWFSVICKIYNLSILLNQKELIGYCFFALNEWSKKSSKYKENELKTKWNSLDENSQSKSKFTNEEHILALQKQYVILTCKNHNICNIYNPNVVYNNSGFTKLWNQLEIDIKRAQLSFAHKIIYNPQNKKKLINDEYNTISINNFNFKTIPKKIEFDSFLSEYSIFTKMILAWIKTMFGEDFLIIINYLSFLIQNFGKRSQVVLILYSKIQGVGKSSLAAVIRILLGKENCKMVSNQSMQSSFTSYAGACAFCYWDEVVVNKNNVDDITAKIKMIATQNIITQIKKGKDETNVSNYANIMMTTNDISKLKFNDEDRRWVLVSIDFETKEEFFNELNKNLKEYNINSEAFFIKLNLFNENELNENYRLALASYLYDFKINENYFKGHAPKTEALEKAIIETSENMEGFIEIRDFIENEEGLYFSNVLVVISDIEKKLDYNSKQISNVLKKLKFENKPRNMFKYGNTIKRKRFWALNLSDQNVDLEITRLYRVHSNELNI